MTARAGVVGHRRRPGTIPMRGIARAWRRAVGNSSGARVAEQRDGRDGEHLESDSELRAQARWCDCAVESVGNQLDESQVAVGRWQRGRGGKEKIYPPGTVDISCVGWRNLASTNSWPRSAGVCVVRWATVRSCHESLGRPLLLKAPNTNRFITFSHGFSWGGHVGYAGGGLGVCSFTPPLPPGATRACHKARPV
jgi:hypothetical protein